MKKDIHPPYHEQAIIECSCGNRLVVGSTKPNIHVEICSACHPFYTGKQKLVDTAGRVDRFRAKIEKAKEKQTAIKSRLEKKKARQAQKKRLYRLRPSDIAAMAKAMAEESSDKK